MPGRAFVTGNAFTDGQATRGWLVGDLAQWLQIGPREAAARFGSRYSRGIEVKLSRHVKGDRNEWKAPAANVTLGILVSGSMEIEFREPDGAAAYTPRVVLSELGAYVLWDGEAFEHQWRALEDTTLLTVRWPDRFAPG